MDVLVDIGLSISNRELKVKRKMQAVGVPTSPEEHLK